MASDVEAMKTRQVILGFESFVEDMILLRCQKILYHIFVFHYAMFFLQYNVLCGGREKKQECNHGPG